MAKSCKQGRFLYRDSSGMIYTEAEVIKLIKSGGKEITGIGVTVKGVDTKDYFGAAVSDYILDAGLSNINFSEKVDNKELVIKYNSDIHTPGVYYIPVDRKKLNKAFGKNLFNLFSNSDAKNLILSIKTVLEKDGTVILSGISANNPALKKIKELLNREGIKFIEETVQIKNNNYLTFKTKKSDDIQDRIKEIENKKINLKVKDGRAYDISGLESSIYTAIFLDFSNSGLNYDKIKIGGPIIRNIIARNSLRGRLMPDYRHIGKVVVYLDSFEDLDKIKERYADNEYFEENGTFGIIVKSATGLPDIEYRYSDNPSKDIQDEHLIPSDRLIATISFDKNKQAQILDFEGGISTEEAEHIIANDEPADNLYEDILDFSESVSLFVDHYFTSKYPGRFDVYYEKVSKEEKAKAKKILLNGLNNGLDLSKAYYILSTIYGEDVIEKVFYNKDILKRIAYASIGMNDRLTERVLDALVYATAEMKKNALSEALLDFPEYAEKIRTLSGLKTLVKKFKKLNLNENEDLNAFWIWYQSQDVVYYQKVGKFTSSALFVLSFSKAVKDGFTFDNVDTYKDIFEPVSKRLFDFKKDYDELYSYRNRNPLIKYNAPYNAVGSSIRYYTTLDWLSSKHSNILDTKLSFGSNELIETINKKDKTMSVLPGATVNVHVVGEYKDANVHAIITVHPYDFGAYGIKIIGLHGPGFNYGTGFKHVKRNFSKVIWFKKSQMYTLKGETVITIYDHKREQVEYQDSVDIDFIRRAEEKINRRIENRRDAEYLPKIKYDSIDEFLKDNIIKENDLFIYRGKTYPSYELASSAALRDYNLLKDVDTSIYDVIFEKFGASWFKEKSKVIYPMFATKDGMYYDYLRKMNRQAEIFATKVIPVGENSDWNGIKIYSENYRIDDNTGKDDIVYIPIMHNNGITENDLKRISDESKLALKKGVFGFLLPDRDVLLWGANKKLKSKLDVLIADLLNAGYKPMKIGKTKSVFYVKSDIVTESTITKADIKHLKYANIINPVLSKNEKLTSSNVATLNFNSAVGKLFTPNKKHIETNLDKENISTATKLLRDEIFPSIFYGVRFNSEELKTPMILQAYNYAKNADAVYIISPLLPKGSVLTRTNRLTARPTVVAEVFYIFEYALSLGKEVYVFDFLQTNKWYRVIKKGKDIVKEEVKRPAIRRNVTGAIPHDIMRLQHITPIVDEYFINHIVATLTGDEVKVETAKKALNKYFTSNPDLIEKGVGVIHNGKLATVLHFDERTNKIKIQYYHSGETKKIFASDVLLIIMSHKFEFVQESVKETEDGNVEIKYSDPIDALAVITPAGVKYYDISIDAKSDKEIGNKFQAKIRARNLDEAFIEFLEGESIREDLKNDENTCDT